MILNYRNIFKLPSCIILIMMDKTNFFSRSDVTSAYLPCSCN